MRIDLFGDTICPWCLIGIRRLRRILAERAARSPEVTPPQIVWRPFQLNPMMPAGGMDRQQYLSAKFGGPDTAARVVGAIARAAAADGIEIDFARIRRTPNTLDSHRVIQLAAAHGRQDSAIDGILGAYFFDGADIGERSTLIAIGVGIGLPEAVIADCLADEADKPALREHERLSRRLGISGVPFMLIDGHYAIAGVQPPEVLTQMLDIAA